MNKILNKTLLCLLVLSISFLGISTQTFAATTTVSYAGTATDLGGGSYIWNNINNATGNTTSTSANSVVVNRNTNSNFLGLTNFNLSTAGLPTTAIINGIQAEVERIVNGDRIRDLSVMLSKDGTTGIGNNLGNNSNGPTTKTITTYGGLTNLWGTTWTSSELLSSNFGIILQYRNLKNQSRTVNVYRVSITIDYTPIYAPTNITLSSNNINEGLSIGSNVGTLTTTDVDVGDTHTYSFTCSTPGVDDSSFAILGSNLNSNEIFNYDTKTTYNICLRSTDSYGLTFDKNFTININDVNQNPTDIILSNNNIYENLPVGTLVGNLSSTDGDSGDSHTYSFACSIPGADDSSFAISGTNLNSNEVFVFATKSIYNICIRTNDGNGGTYDKNFTINIAEQIPSPGGSSVNLQIWLKADAGTSTTTSGNALNTWNDQSGNGFNATAGVAPTYLNNTTDNLNFNPFVDFNGTTSYMENLNNGAYSQSYFAVIVPDNQVDGTLSGQTPFSFECDAAYINTGVCGLPFGGLTLGAFTVAMNDEVISHAMGAGATGWRSAQIGSASYGANKPMLINMNENATADGTEISEKGFLLDNYNANTYQTLSGTDYRLGMTMDAANPFVYDGKIAEIINYSSRISIVDRDKIESYLALKYGITLENGTMDYIASDGSTNMWSTSSAGVYINNIFGIGRDDLSELGQVKSKSVDDDSVITLEAISEGTNIANSFIDIDDLEFLTISNNDGGNTWSPNDSPVGYYILDRKWKVQETGEVGTLNLDFDVSNLNFDVPAPSTGTGYYFTYDSDNDNNLNDETPIIMTNISGSIWQISGINLNNGQIFTITTQSSTNNIPTNITLSNNNINENVTAGTTIGTFSTTDADSGDSHTYTFVSGSGDDDNIYFNITGSVLSILHSPDYEIKQSYSIRIQTDDGNGGQYQKNFTININNLGETIPSLLDFENPLDDFKYTNTSGNWSRTTTNPYEGLYSLESDNGGLNNTQSCFEMSNLLTQTGTINFYYNVSSQLDSDYLKFYIDNVEQQTWSGTIPWTLYEKTDVPAGAHMYKWCYIKDNIGSAGTDNAFIDFVATQPTTTESNPPIISAINYSSGFLLPGGNHNIIINYSDSESGIDTTSDIISLNKWNGSIWGADISSTGFNLGSKSVTSIQSTYPTNNLNFGKYRYNFWISDNDGNTSSTGAVFYIDEPSLLISSGSLDIGKITPEITKFSTGELVLTVETVGAGFDLLLNKASPLINGSIEIIDWNGSEGVGYDTSPYSSTINIINLNEIIATQVGSINTDGDKNSYIYSIKLGALVGKEQSAGDYNSSINFTLDLDY